jgi:hypothetical protein
MSPETRARKRVSLRNLQRDLKRNPHRPQLVVVPSFGGIPDDMLDKIEGIDHYVERTLSHSLWHLKNPEVELVFVSPRPVNAAMLASHLSCLPADAITRFHVVVVEGASTRCLTRGLLDDVRALRELHGLVRPELALLVPFLVSEDEIELACTLGIPLEGPVDIGLNTKTGSHRVFRDAKVPHQRAQIDLRSVQDLQSAVRQWYEAGGSDAIAIKLDAGVSGLGNLHITRKQLTATLVQLQRERAPRTAREHRQLLSRAVRRTIVETGRSWVALRRDLAEGFIVEEWFQGRVISSPSVQGFISPAGEVGVVATHDQMLEGQVFKGASFPAFPHDPTWRKQLMSYGESIARVLARKGALGNFAADFIFGQTPSGAHVLSAIEINLRQGGTTHPYRNALGLKEVSFDRESGLLVDGDGTPLYYVATDNGHSEAMKGYSTDEMLGLLSRFDLNTHLVVPEQGKIGFQVFGPSPQAARDAFDEVTEYLAALPKRQPDSMRAVQQG